MENTARYTLIGAFALACLLGAFGFEAGARFAVVLVAFRFFAAIASKVTGRPATFPPTALAARGVAR